MFLHHDLVRTVLLHVEKHSSDVWIDLWIYGQQEEAVIACVRWLHHLGYVIAVSYFVDQREFWKSVCLTEKGRAFLDAARDETAWRQAKETASRRSTTCDLSDLLAILQKAATTGARTLPPNAGLT